MMIVPILLLCDPLAYFDRAGMAKRRWKEIRKASSSGLCDSIIRDRRAARVTLDLVSGSCCPRREERAPAARPLSESRSSRISVSPSCSLTFLFRLTGSGGWGGLLFSIGTTIRAGQRWSKGHMFRGEAVGRRASGYVFLESGTVTLTFLVRGGTM